MADLYWDPFDVELDSAPHEMWRRMRDEAPVYRNDRYDFFALTRYADVEAAHRDTATFSSAHGTVLETMGPERNPTTMMIFLDPPEHTELRHLVSRAFTPRRIAEVEPAVRQICASLLDAQDGDFDFLQDFGALVPSRVISALLGVPPEDQEEQRHNIDGIFHIEPEVGMVNRVSIGAAMNLAQYVSDQLEARRNQPRDDLLTALVQADLSVKESVEFAVLLYSAGTETVARLLGNAAIVLAEHPEQRAALVKEPDLIPNGIEELLRFEAPSPVQGRWTTRSVTLHGTEIPEGSKVLLLTGSAGRDERAFPDPDRFDVRRHMDHHVSFGHGIHFCVGAALARMEGRVALEEMFKRHPEWEVDTARAERLHTSTVRGWAKVPIRV